jgi:hypothetical protein
LFSLFIFILVKQTPYSRTLAVIFFRTDMVPIKTYKNGQVIDIRTGELYDSIVEICNEHRLTNRALAFAFILYNYKNPQIYKILDDEDYWRALNGTSGRYLTVFYISQPDSYFGQDLAESDGKEQRGLHGLMTYEQLVPLLKPYFQLDEKIDLPAVLFFQEHNGLLTDYFLLGLDENKLEESFWELQQYIQTAVDNLEMIKKENHQNSHEIFTQLKLGVEGQRTKRKIFKATQSFPLQLFAGWITGKV